MTYDLYERETDFYNENLYDNSLFKFLLLQIINPTYYQKDNYLKELEYFFNIHGDKYNITDFKLYLFDNQLSIDNHNGEAKLNYIQYNNNQIEIAILLRNTLFKIISLKNLLDTLKKGNIEWSDNQEYIKELDNFINKMNSN